MKLRIPTALLLVLYVAVACCFGVVHDHHHGSHDCAACAWLINAVTDVPGPTAQIVTTVVVSTPSAPAVVVVLAPVMCSTASRAPPLASA